MAAIDGITEEEMMSAWRIEIETDKEDTRNLDTNNFQNMSQPYFVGGYKYIMLNLK